jgi:hypothetical protein
MDNGFRLMRHELKICSKRGTKDQHLLQFADFADLRGEQGMIELTPIDYLYPESVISGVKTWHICNLSPTVQPTNVRRPPIQKNTVSPGLI